ncbi:MAG: type III-B CRISPR-associated protein Cas10/Cmr2 [Verrucomicrobiae bacterium]|nr:type III-B CRISPR-associated protein Cas10/Cmr2 [Verrucomicrobiae bacterium]
MNWKAKLAAYLHDPPHKPVGIQHHEQERGSFLNRFGLSSEDMAAFEKSADWQAAAADRLIFPDPAKSKLRVDWKGSWMEFCHPLGGGRLRAGAFPPTAAQLEIEITRAVEAVALRDAQDWSAKFIAGWRLWPELAAREQNPHHAYLVADTRIPDHTLWHHNALAATFTGCNGKPAFLLFQIGPVQDFIAQARKTQDLWSGSYLLSLLIAQAMLAVADQIGPDAIIFPQLRGLPLADFHWWKRGYLGDLKFRASHPNELLTPNLPNRFLALVPTDQGTELAQTAAAAVHQTWNDIAAKVKTFLDKQLNGQCPDWDQHWTAQIARFPAVDWVVHPWSKTSEALQSAANGTPPLPGGWQKHALRQAQRWAEEFIPTNEREAYGPCSNAGFAWALHFATTDWKLAAAKNARGFAAWQSVGRLNADGVPKDHLDGRNEVLGGPDHERFWQVLRERCPKQFKGSQLYGALSVIKRLWPEVYLPDTLDLDCKDHGHPVFQPVDAIAQIDDAISNDQEGAETYYAVLCMDGDDMGQWISGSKAAPLLNSLAQEAQDYFRRHWQTGEGGLAADQVQRPLSPGYHVAISEALSNFSLYCAGPIVRAFGGQLIYAGGDDVLAMLPARNALDCAQALQLTFRGVNPDHPDAHASEEVKAVLGGLFDFPAPGFITCKRDAGYKTRLKPNWPLLVMGPKATASVGIAIGHVRSPMQDTIQAAREAERLAKEVPNKGAFALQVLKRSGEAVGFTARWSSGVVSVWSELEAGIHDLSGRFAYRYASLVKALVVTGGGPDGAGYASEWTETLREVIEAELRHVLIQQGDFKADKAREQAQHWCAILTEALNPRDYLHFWMTWAFINRLTKPSTDD